MFATQTNVKEWYDKIIKTHGRGIANKAMNHLKKWDEGQINIMDMFYSNSVLANCLQYACDDFIKEGEIC